MSTSLRILVPVKRVIDYAIKPRVNKTHTAIETTNIKHSLNPFDELSLEEAIRLRERGPLPVPDILAFTAGPAKSADILRTAMAMGADRSIHVVLPPSSPPLEPLQVAKLLAHIATRENSNLIILGKQAIDSDAAQTGPMVAGLLGWSQATCACKVQVEEGGEGVVVTREVDGGTEKVRGRLPMVVTADLRLNEPRYASLPNIMRAKKKVVEKMEMGELGVGEGGRLRTVRVEEPPPRKGGGKVESVDGMIARLKELGAI